MATAPIVIDAIMLGGDGLVFGWNKQDVGLGLP